MLFCQRPVCHLPVQHLLLLGNLLALVKLTEVVTALLRLDVVEMHLHELVMKEGVTALTPLLVHDLSLDLLLDLLSPLDLVASSDVILLLCLLFPVLLNGQPLIDVEWIWTLLYFGQFSGPHHGLIAI